MFKVGDRVEMIGTYNPSPGIGRRGTVIRTNSEDEAFIQWDNGFHIDGPYHFQEIKKLGEQSYTPEDNYLENFRAAIREELSNWRDPKQIDGEHYTDLVIQPLDVAYLNGMNSGRTKVCKYVMRSKNGLQDLRKARDMILKVALYEYGVDLEKEK